MTSIELAVALSVIFVLAHRIIMKPLPGRRHSLFYAWYLGSPIWHARRFLWYWTSNRRCEGCGQKLVLHAHGLRWRMGASVVTVHHKNYHRLGHERRSDVSLMCWRCHKTHDAWRFRGHV